MSASTKNDKNRKANSWEKIGRNLIYPTMVEAEVKFRNIRSAYGRYLKRLKTLPSGSGRNTVPREFRNLEWLNPHIANRLSSTNLRSKSTSAMLFAAIFPSTQRARNFDIFADRNVWKQSALRSSTIVFDHMETSLISSNIGSQTPCSRDNRHFKGVLHLKYIFLENNCVGQFWYHVKELRTLTSKLSFSLSHVTLVNE